MLSMMTSPFPSYFFVMFRIVCIFSPFPRLLRRIRVFDP